MSAGLLTEKQASQSNAAAPVDEENKNLTPQYLWNDEFRFERERLQTFENWPLEWLDKNMLAITGMFYTGVEDQTKCYFCELIIKRWERTDDPVQEHLKWSPNCPLLKRRTTNNVPLSPKDLDLILPVIDSTRDIPPCTARKPIPCHDYSIKMVRLHSFADWPRSLKQRPEQLVDAGFYYKGVGDSVICFSCLGGLKDWEEDDDPWEQHALWMGHFCPYVKLVKGEEFIAFVYNKFKNYHPYEMRKQGEENESGLQKPLNLLELEDYKMCKICFDKECNTAYVPCGHVVACTDCALAATYCPMCRASIKSVVRLYFS